MVYTPILFDVHCFFYSVNGFGSDFILQAYLILSLRLTIIYCLTNYCKDTKYSRNPSTLNSKLSD